MLSNIRLASYPLKGKEKPGSVEAFAQQEADK